MARTESLFSSATEEEKEAILAELLLILSEVWKLVPQAISIDEWNEDLEMMERFLDQGYSFDDVVVLETEDDSIRVSPSDKILNFENNE